MSLASLHLLFIALSTLLAVSAGVWGLAEWSGSGSMTGLVWGGLSLLMVPVLMVYGVRVRRKLKALGAFSG
jgi:steroid 5-alpha reductase family enzyme